MTMQVRLRKRVWARAGAKACRGHPAETSARSSPVPSKHGPETAATAVSRGKQRREGTASDLGSRIVSNAPPPPRANPPASQDYPARLLRESERPRHALKRRLKEVVRRLEAGKASCVDIAMPWRRPEGRGTVAAID